MLLHLACFTRSYHNNLNLFFLGLKHCNQNCLVALAMRSTRFLEMKWGIIKHDVLYSLEISSCLSIARI